MICSAQAMRRRRLSLALGTSAVVWGFALPSVVQAQCAPDPTVANGTTTCTGVDANGIRVTTPGTMLVVASGASVTNTGASAIAVDVPRSNTTSYPSNTITVQGSVWAAGQNAITVSSGAPYAGGYSSTQYATLTVATGGSVSGTTALALLQSADNTSGVISATVDNAGTLTGTGGTALSGNVTATGNGYSSTLGSFATITNRGGARIVGGIVGPVSTLTNAGSIDGGSGSAVNTGSSSFYTTVTNAATGTIRAASTAAAVQTGTGSLTVTNAGTIANTGTGAALAGGALTITNQAGGQITSAGTGAIGAATSLFLTNAGAITGNVTTGNGANTVDSTAGTINGSVTFGSGNDTMVARYAGTRTLATGITGAIDGGSGTNAERVVFAADTSVATPIDLATNFQQLILAPAATATATLQSGFTTSAPLVLSGAGTVVNRATITLPGQAVIDLDYAFGSSAAFRNEGSITTTPSASNSGLVLSNHSFTNVGTVTVNGGTGVSMSYNPVINNGTITASGTGVTVFDGVLTNSGTIVSTAGAGANLNGNVGYTGSNSGTIRGAATGVTTGIYLTNTGIITSAGTGVAIQPYGYLINAAGGVVNGGSGGAVTAYAFNAGVANAGTINGNVTYSNGDNSLNYIALPGGVLNGNLALSGGVLVTNLVNTGPGQFAGVTGTVSATSGAALRYAVNADATAALPTGAIGPFTTVGYQLANGATLTLTAPAGQRRTQPLVLAGNGTVDLNATIATTDAVAIQSTTAISYPSTATVTGALSITSRGALSATRTSANSPYYGGAVSLAYTDSFTNAGTLQVADRTSYPIAAIYNGANVTNTGTITLDGATGINGAVNVTNSGSIAQATGGVASAGIVGATTINNSGIISVGGTAVQFSNYYGSASTLGLTNSGTISSTRGLALTSAGYGPITISNQAGATIAGGAGQAIQAYAATLTNAGTITGSADLGYSSPTLRSYLASAYVAAGGTLSGNLAFGAGDDLLLQTGDSLGISGRIDGGLGTNVYGRSLSQTGSAAIDPAGLTNFQNALIEAAGTSVVATATATGTFGGTLYAVGTGSVVNQATIAGGLFTNLPGPAATLLAADQGALLSLTNKASVAGGVSGTAAAFANSGTIGSASLAYSGVSLNGVGSFANDGTITSTSASTAYNVGGYYYGTNRVPTVLLSGPSVMAIGNTGTITGGGLTATATLAADTPGALTIGNTGAITSANGFAAVDAELTSAGVDAGGTISLTNTGTITGTGLASNGPGSAIGVFLGSYAATKPVPLTVANSGTVAATAVQPVSGAAGSAVALEIGGNGLGTTTITNAAGGMIMATGPGSAYGMAVFDTNLSLINAGTISALGATKSVAVYTLDAYANSVRNTGRIIGDVLLAGGADTADNAGSITGNVSLGAGDDSFTQRVGGTVSGLVDGGDGADRYLVDTTGGATTLTAGQIANFERVTQTGTGVGTYSGTFGVDTINLAGGTLSVAAGQTLATAGETTVTGVAGSGNLSVINAGAIAGGITFADGNDTVVNTGRIGGRVQFGSGDDTYTEGLGSSVGGVDGGAGTNLYRVVLAGDRSGIGARSNFQNLAVDGTGTLAVTLDQNFGSIALTGTNLSLSMGNYTVGQITATGPAAQVTLDHDVGSVQLGAGNDTLAIGAAALAGRYDGGAGMDTLRLTNAGAVTLSGVATGFETVSLTGNALTITGTLGSAGQALAIMGGDKSVTVARGGTLAGAIDLGAGNDGFRLAAGGVLAGTVSGGAGSNGATLDLSAGDMTLRAATLTNFQRLATEGAGTLTLAGGSFGYNTLAAAGNLTVAADANLATTIAFGPADDRLAIAGGFAGAVDGGAGNDSIEVSGGTAAAPVAFSNIANVEAYRMNGGLATVSGTAALGSVTLTGGRLVGLAGSSMTAASFAVGQGATFGSAGTVNGNVSVAGTLSPGASPGTMTVNGNVSLASGSTSLFEITPTVSDKLIVNGAVSIANGATLQFAPSGLLRPGTSYDLIVASGGITGGFTTVIKPDTLFGFLVQRADRIQLLGQFLAVGGGTPQVNRSIAYANATLAAQPATSTLFSALPALLTAGGASNAQAFAQLTPEPYASATQLGVDNALALVDTARGPSFATTGEEVHAYTFAVTLGQWHQLGDNNATGASATRTQGYGFLGGVGVGSDVWSVGAFGGYLNGRQHIDALGVQTKTDGLVAGVHGRFRAGSGLGLSASVLYDGGAARTARVLPAGPLAVGRYDLHSIISDVQLSYEVATSAGWSLRPHAGVTYLRTTRDGATEAGGSPFALTVARDRHVAGFADGGVSFGRADGATEPFRPWVAFGVRYQTQGMQTDALAGYAGGGLGIDALGASRARAVGTAAGGVAYRLPSGLDLFASASSQTGTDDHQESVSAGARLRF